MSFYASLQEQQVSTRKAIMLFPSVLLQEHIKVPLACLVVMGKIFCPVHPPSCVEFCFDLGFL